MAEKPIDFSEAKRRREAAAKRATESGAASFAEEVRASGADRPVSIDLSQFPSESPSKVTGQVEHDLLLRVGPNGNDISLKGSPLSARVFDHPEVREAIEQNPGWKVSLRVRGEHGRSATLEVNELGKPVHELLERQLAAKPPIPKMSNVEKYWLNIKHLDPGNKAAVAIYGIATLMSAYNTYKTAEKISQKDEFGSKHIQWNVVTLCAFHAALTGLFGYLAHNTVKVNSVIR